jgi:hypothetical protein
VVSRSSERFNVIGEDVRFDLLGCARHVLEVRGQKFPPSFD